MEQGAYRYFILNKPFNMVSQFISPDKVHLLGELDFTFPPGTNAVGRLDKNSEGLLLLTNNTAVTRLLFQGKHPHRRTYLVQVMNKVSEKELDILRGGVNIEIKGPKNYLAKPTEATIVKDPGIFKPLLSENPYATYSWLSITLTEGKFHEVRKMVKAIHHPCQRLIRTSIADIELGDLPSGKVKEMEESRFFTLLHL